MFSATLRGAGKTLTVAVIVVVMCGLVRLPIARVGANSLGPTGVWLSIAARNLLRAGLAYVWYRRGHWRRPTDSTRATHTGVQAADD